MDMCSLTGELEPWVPLVGPPAPGKSRLRTICNIVLAYGVTTV
jgi:hypothetical protein